ncbi:MAG: hypothetical protein ACJAWF_003297, partial [Candidatus Azotimanducaceae bacterium]
MTILMAGTEKMRQRMRRWILMGLFAALGLTSLGVTHLA